MTMARLFFTAVLIVNCLVTLINGRTIQKSLTQPYNKLLPPPVPEIATATTIRTATTKATIFSAEKIPKIGIEALLPPKLPLPSPSLSPSTPLVGQAYKQIAANITTTRTTATSIARLKTTTTTKPVTISTILKPKSSIPLPALEALLPPHLEEDDAKGIENNKKNRFKETQGLASKPKIIHDRIATPSLEVLLPPLIASETIRIATVTESDLSKTTKNPTHNHTALSKHLNESQKQQSQNLQHTRPAVVAVVNPITMRYKNKPEKQEFSITTQRHVASEPLSRATFKPNVNILNEEQHVAKHHFSKYDYSYGLTTIRPIKNGLPTITPFPHTVKRKK
uniref:Uncharacterized protein n=1 Tax=Glossina austeni TaxID=7395 RepID=A0A1A9VTW9_GLOAU